jgi:RND family efflux transporter MFP subunit
MLSFAQIRSPFAGIVSQRSIDTGHFVQPGMSAQVAMFLVERIDTLRVAVDVPEREAVQVQKGNAAWIQIPSLGKEEFQGTVSRTSWVLDPASRTLRVEIDLPNPQRTLRPGMYAKARIELSSSALTAAGN